jgi:plasmid stabilization system protein ParE
MAVRFLPRARAQLRDIHAHMALDDAITAQAFMLRVEEAVDIIARDPAVGRVISRRGVRRFPLTPYPYFIYYKPADAIQILSVLHDTRPVPRFHEPAPEFAR